MHKIGVRYTGIVVWEPPPARWRNAYLILTITRYDQAEFPLT